MFKDNKLERIESLEIEIKEQKMELERLMSTCNSLLNRCKQLSENNTLLKKQNAEDRAYCERQFASIDRVLEKHGFRIHTTYYAVFPKVADFNSELDRIFETNKNANRKP